MRNVYVPSSVINQEATNSIVSGKTFDFNKFLEDANTPTVDKTTTKITKDSLSTNGGSTNNIAKGEIKILSVTPDNNLISGSDTTFKVTVNYSFDGINQAIIYLGFNNEEVNRYSICDEKMVTEKSGQCTFLVTTKVKDWGSQGDFLAYANISQYPHPDDWSPITSNKFKLSISK